MSLLLVGEIRPDAAVPNLGPALARHLAEKAHPRVLASSVAAWNLLAEGLKRLGAGQMGEVIFDPGGKPRFEGDGLHFSLSHSANLAAALICPAPCGVDLEQQRPEAAARLRDRCLAPRERAAGRDFFECWTRKECIAKLDGRGLRAHPSDIDTLDPRWQGRFRSLALTDNQGLHYTLSLLCEDPQAVEVLRI